MNAGRLGGPWRWGRALTSISGPADGPRLLHFADGTTAETDLVIGADGAFSRVRPAVSPAVPQYSGVSFLEAWFSDVDNRHPQIAELVGQGSAAAADGERGLFAQRNSGGHIRVYIIRRAPADWIERNGLTIDDTAAIRALLLSEYAAWAPSLRRLIADNDGRYVDRPIFALPVPHTWEHNPTVTLLRPPHAPARPRRQPRPAGRLRAGPRPGPVRHGRRRRPRLRGDDPQRSQPVVVGRYFPRRSRPGPTSPVPGGSVSVGRTTAGLTEGHDVRQAHDPRQRRGP